MEVPQYTLRPNTNAMVAPWILKLLGLAILFYAGIYFNVKFAMGRSIPPAINLFIFVFLIVLVVTQVILYRIKFGKYKYMFYTDRVEFEGKKTETFFFNDFQQAGVKQKLFEKMFDTGELSLSKSFRIGPISNVTQVRSYIEQLVQYHHAMQERSRAQEQQAAMQKQMGYAAQRPSGYSPPGADRSQPSVQPSSSQPSSSRPAPQPSADSSGQQQSGALGGGGSGSGGYPGGGV
ncbi:hypothetical protein JW898_03270 [Candidatus Woesearchaeota archaeon]|nr:hypothetical protein [Candidatus Woesearchaeota archaeon]